jgi:hypothetical protein
LNRVLRFCLVSLVLIGFDLPARGAERTVIVMLFDGFAPAYFEFYPTPAFDRMRAQGAWTNRMEPGRPVDGRVEQSPLRAAESPAER